MDSSPEHKLAVVTLEQHREVIEALDRLRLCVDRIDTRVTSHMVAEHKDFDELINVVKGGKMAAKFIGIVIACVVGIVGAGTWLRETFHISLK